jgi:hypothetical protein
MGTQITDNTLSFTGRSRSARRRKRRELTSMEAIGLRVPGPNSQLNRVLGEGFRSWTAAGSHDSYRSSHGSPGCGLLTSHTTTHLFTFRPRGGCRGRTAAGLHSSY